MCPVPLTVCADADSALAKFRQLYRSDISTVPDFFSADTLRRHFPDRRVKLVTSIAMFYDLEAPQAFADQVASILAEDGVWHFEQSYLPSMLRTTSYDTVCHEHLEYYALRQIKWIADHAGLKIIDVAFNAVNGGSFAVTVAPTTAHYPECTEKIRAILDEEDRMGLSLVGTYLAFATRVMEHKISLLKTVRSINARNMKVLGYGASTKGNVLLQYCGLSAAEIPCIADVNSDKFGCVTPGTWIPIVSEADAKAANPDYFLVLPWHFRENLVAREQEFLRLGGKMIFPLPAIDVVEANLLRTGSSGN